MNKIRNFCIISHINHGKSTLADQFVKLSKQRSELIKKDNSQLMDSMELEQQRGITIKLNMARFTHEKDGQKYQFNLIDTPGHVDFAYEVARSLSACEGAILLVDAGKGVQAQTLSNLRQAQKKGLKIIAAINKIDLKNTEIEKHKQIIARTLKINEDKISLLSAKENIGITELLDRVVEEISPPAAAKNENLKALIFDAYYDRFQGVTLFVRVFAGTLQKKQKIKLLKTGKVYQVTNLMIKRPQLEDVDQIMAGEVGLIQANIKSMASTLSGDTIVSLGDSKTKSVINYEKIRPVVYANFFSGHNEDYKELEIALEKIKLNDNSFTTRKISSPAFGHGFQCGFLGVLHMDIIRERVQMEYKVDVIISQPTVLYKFINKNGEALITQDPNEVKNWSTITKIMEPVARTIVLVPIVNLGPVMTLIMTSRGRVLEQTTINSTTVEMVCMIPLAELILDFFNTLKSITHGYGSVGYEQEGYESNEKLSPLYILLNDKPVEIFTKIVPNAKAYHIGRKMCEKLQELIPRQNFKVAVQAALHNKVIARTNIAPFKKAVADKCYGGDITRKRKLWDKQKKGKKKMKRIGNVDLPFKIFSEMLKIS